MNHEMSIEKKSVHEGHCNGCSIDQDLYKMKDKDYDREGKIRMRMHINFNGHVVRLCPSCAKQLVGMMIDF